jgi:hypothetical protein
MSIIPPISPLATPGSREVVYPSSDGRPVAETPIHRKNLLLTIDVLEDWFAAEPLVYVSGNMFVYYVQGDKWKHVSPDVFVVRGVPKDKPRDYYLVWEEGASPDLVNNRHRRKRSESSPRPNDNALKSGRSKSIVCTASLKRCAVNSRAVDSQTQS